MASLSNLSVVQVLPELLYVELNVLICQHTVWYLPILA